MSVKILTGDVRKRIRDIPDESVHCVITSPPYWHLREYDEDATEGMIGLEPTLDEHIDVLMGVFGEVWRVLRKDGIFWLNYGDVYAGSWGAQSHSETPAKPAWRNKIRNHPKRAPPTSRFKSAGCKAKDMMLIPARLSLALQASGWWVRSKVIWHKRNPRPEGARDRPKSSYEEVFLLTKAKRYYYDAFGCMEPVTGGAKPRRKDGRLRMAKGEDPNDKRGLTDARWLPSMETKRNLTDVWTLAATGYRGQHFAVFPPQLVERCIKSSTSDHGVCVACETPWRRIVEVSGGTIGKSWHDHIRDSTHGNITSHVKFNNDGPDKYRRVHKGWEPGCDCGVVDVKPATVLDPFGGAGTVALVADRLRRDAILIELSDYYAELARERVVEDAGMFGDNVEIDR